jgi:hypothetical protein
MKLTCYEIESLPIVIIDDFYKNHSVKKEIFSSKEFSKYKTTNFKNILFHNLHSNNKILIMNCNMKELDLNILFNKMSLSIHKKILISDTTIRDGNHAVRHKLSRSSFVSY